MCERATSIRLLRRTCDSSILIAWSVVDEWRITCQVDNGKLLVSEMIRVRRKIKVERVREFYRETSTGSMEDKWFIPFWKIHSFRKYSSFCHFFPLFYCYIHDYWRREKERERKNKIYRVSVLNCKIRDVIFMSFLPRLRGWLNYEFFLISIRYV